MSTGQPITDRLVKREVFGGKVDGGGGRLMECQRVFLYSSGGLGIALFTLEYWIYLIFLRVQNFNKNLWWGTSPDYLIALCFE